MFIFCKVVVIGLCFLLGSRIVYDMVVDVINCHKSLVNLEKICRPSAIARNKCPFYGFVLTGDCNSMVESGGPSCAYGCVGCVSECRDITDCEIADDQFEWWINQHDYRVKVFPKELDGDFCLLRHWYDYVMSTDCPHFEKAKTKN